MQQGQTVFFENRPKIVASAAVAGPKECAGVLGEYVDLALTDDMFGESTFERAERKMLLWAVEKSIEKAGLPPGGVDAVLSGDLLNQIVSAGFAARETGLPFLGIYSACSTMSEALPAGRRPRGRRVCRPRRRGDGQPLRLGGSGSTATRSSWATPARRSRSGRSRARAAP